MWPGAAFFCASLLGAPVDGGYPLGPALYLCADMRRPKTLTFVAEMKEEIVVVLVFYKRKPHEVMRVAIW